VSQARQARLDMIHDMLGLDESVRIDILALLFGHRQFRHRRGRAATWADRGDPEGGHANGHPCRHSHPSSPWIFGVKGR
jgi:hypothetical protein